MPVSAPLIEIQKAPPLLCREREVTIRLKAGCADHYSPRKTLVLPQPNKYQKPMALPLLFVLGCRILH